MNEGSPTTANATPATLVSDTSVASLVDDYLRDGVVWPVPIVDGEEAAQHRGELESAEATIGPLHYINKIHTVMRSPYELATHPAVLDVVESFIGPDVLLYNSTYIIKEPGTDAYVAWHQDLTYWGLADDDAQVSMWLALAPATAQSGCMVAVTGSHTEGRVEHVERPDDSNVLLLGQQIEGLDDSSGVACELAPGEASFHHGWTVHRSNPNITDDRRIGLNVQYVAPHNRQAGAANTATLVRGTDKSGFYTSEPTPKSQLDIDRAKELFAADRAMKDSFKTK